MNTYQNTPKFNELRCSSLNGLNNHSYTPRLHERVIDHIQDHSSFYKGLIATAVATSIASLFVYAASRPEPDYLSSEDKEIMQNQIRLEKLIDSGVPLKHIELDDGTIHTIPLSDYEAENQ